MRNCAQGSWAAGPCKLPSSKTKDDFGHSRARVSSVAVTYDRQEDNMHRYSHASVYITAKEPHKTRMSRLTS